MVVQAQYPSNILLLNRNAAQQGGHHHDYSSLQPHPPPPPPPGLDQPLNSSKRPRDHATQTGLPLNNLNLINPLQSHAFSSQIHHFLLAQEDQLRRALAEKRQKHYRALLTAAEDSATRRLREKEDEVEKATRRNSELQARAAYLAAEAQVWQAKARAQEAAAASLQVQLHQTMMVSAVCGGDDGGAGVSCAVEGHAEDEESAYVDPDRVVVVSSAAARRKCRGCGRRVASVVVLPCRHLCMCCECDAHFRACPVCLTIKNSTVEVSLS